MSPLATVYMYTVYNDLLHNQSKAAAERHTELQKSRDAVLFRAMKTANLPNFALPENEIDAHVSFLQTKTREIPLLNILLIYKSGGKEVRTTLIRRGELSSYPDKTDALDIITNTKNEINYTFIPIKVSDT
jgi:hypothetical protein